MKNTLPINFNIISNILYEDTTAIGPIDTDINNKVSVQYKGHTIAVSEFGIDEMLEFNTKQDNKEIICETASMVEYLYRCHAKHKIEIIVSNRIEVKSRGLEIATLQLTNMTGVRSKSIWSVTSQYLNLRGINTMLEIDIAGWIVEGLLNKINASVYLIANDKDMYLDDGRKNTNFISVLRNARVFKTPFAAKKYIMQLLDIHPDRSKPRLSTIPDNWRIMKFDVTDMSVTELWDSVTLTTYLMYRRGLFNIFLKYNSYWMQVFDSMFKNDLEYFDYICGFDYNVIEVFDILDRHNIDDVILKLVQGCITVIHSDVTTNIIFKSHFDGEQMKIVKVQELRDIMETALKAPL